jgi:hypothetical protein
MMPAVAANQRCLHDYYLPTCDLDSTELGSYRVYVTKLQPSLPHQAGRAFGSIRQIFDRLYELSGGDPAQLHRLVGRFTPPYASVRGSHGQRTIQAQAIAHAHLDLPRLARAYLGLLRQLTGDNWPSPSERLAPPRRPQSDAHPH